MASENPWFTSGLWARTGFGLLFAAGYVMLVIDLLKKAVAQEEHPSVSVMGHAQPEPAPWVEQRYFPLMGFAVLFLAMALWARRGDLHP